MRERRALWGAQPSRSRFALSCALIAPLLVGCALDTRTLQGTEGSASGGSSSAGGSGSGGGGSHPHKPAPDPMDLPVCSYSDSQVKTECQTLIDNAGFNKNIDGWQAEPLAITVDWAQDDADANPHSGSISVLNTMHGTNEGLAFGAGMECLPAAPGDTFDMAGDVFIPKGQGDGLKDDMGNAVTYVGEAGLSIFFWPSSDCSDLSPTQGSFQTTLITDVGEWQHVKGAALAPDTAKAMTVRVLTVKPFKQFGFQALFDNLLVRKR